MANIIFWIVVGVVVLITVGVCILFKNVVLDYDESDEQARTESTNRTKNTKKDKMVQEDSIRGKSDPKGEK